MSSCTALCVVSNVQQIGRTVRRALERQVTALYIHLNIPAETRLRHSPPQWGRLISQLYVDSNSSCCACGKTPIDLRVLVGNLRPNPLLGLRQLKPIDVIFSDCEAPVECETLRTQFDIPTETECLSPAEEEERPPSPTDFAALADADAKVYDTVVLGGTFDRIHLGHKIFLTQAVLRACRRLVVGVTTQELTQSKTLPELILPVEQRIAEVREFLLEIDSSLHYEIVPIDDPFGPTKSDPAMDLIVVSAETLRGGHKVNEVRTEANLRPLEIFCIEVVESDDASGPKEHKISSSNTRVDLLGTRLHWPEPRPYLPREPYIIGLTGCIASGKSQLSERFRRMGATVLDCDKIAHAVYAPGRPCHARIVEHFGTAIMDIAGHIDRAKLGAIVFENAAQLEALNGMVWPELLAEVKQRLQTLRTTGDEEGVRPRVVFLEAAVLFKAGWESECHEVWSIIVPRPIAIQRVMERNRLSETEATQRLASQLDNREYVARSHVIFSSQWEPDFTQKQAERAWQMLNEELDQQSVASNL